MTEHWLDLDQSKAARNMMFAEQDFAMLVLIAGITGNYWESQGGIFRSERDR